MFVLCLRLINIFYVKTAGLDKSSDEDSDDDDVEDDDGMKQLLSLTTCCHVTMHGTLTCLFTVVNWCMLITLLTVAHLMADVKTCIVD